MTQDIVLFAHGSRDAQWAQPFAEEGVRSVRVVPVFLGKGGHVSEAIASAIAHAK